MKKIKQLLLALVASFGALTTCAELSVNGTIVHNGAKGDGWEYSDYRVWLKDSGKTYTVTGEDYARRIGIHVKAKNCKMIADNLVLCPTNGNHYACGHLRTRKCGDQDRRPERSGGRTALPGGGGAGIGGDLDNRTAGVIEITGGTIYAFGDKEIDDEHWQLGGGAAGIGGAMRYHFSDNPYEYDLWLVGGECMQVVNSGGTVYAHGPRTRSDHLLRLRRRLHVLSAAREKR